MTDTDPTRSAPTGEEPVLPPQPEPDTSGTAEDPGYLTRTGEAAGDDGSVVPIIGGLPAAPGSVWDTGAPLEDRGVDLAEEQASLPEQASPPDTASS